MNDSSPAEDVATLKQELELEKLERQWLEEKQRHLASSYGEEQGGWIRTCLGPAHPGLGVISGIIVIAAGLWSLSDPEMFDVGLFAIVAGIVTLGVASAMLWHQGRKTQAYNEAKRRYEDQRQHLLQDIAASRERANARKGNDQSAE